MQYLLIFQVNSTERGTHSYYTLPTILKLVGRKQRDVNNKYSYYSSRELVQVSFLFLTYFFKNQEPFLWYGGYGGIPVDWFLLVSKWQPYKVTMDKEEFPFFSRVSTQRSFVFGKMRNLHNSKRARESDSSRWSIHQIHITSHHY